MVSIVYKLNYYKVPMSLILLCSRRLFLLAVPLFPFVSTKELDSHACNRIR